MIKVKARAVTACIMILLAAVLYAVVRFRPETLVAILWAFAVPGFVACGVVLYEWLIAPEAPKKHSDVKHY